MQWWKNLPHQSWFAILHASRVLQDQQKVGGVIRTDRMFELFRRGQISRMGGRIRKQRHQLEQEENRVVNR
jgi:hypothetical protein